MQLAQRLAEYISACFTGLWIESHEHDDALREIAGLCREQNWRLATWNVEEGLQIPGQANGQSADAGGNDPLAAIRSINALASADSSAVLVLVNFHRYLQSAEIVQALAKQITLGKQNRTFLIVLSPLVSIPIELEKLFAVIEHDLPSREQVEEIARGVATEAGELPDGLELNRVLDAAAGLTRYEAENAFSLSLVRHERIEPESIWELKGGMLKKSGLLQLHRGGERFADLGGLEPLKAFCLRAMRNQGHRDPLRRPKGVLLLSPPGCGKRLAEELPQLRRLPDRRRESYKRVPVRVDTGSLIHVDRNTYSIPSRLIGERVEVRLIASNCAGPSAPSGRRTASTFCSSPAFGFRGKTTFWFPAARSSAPPSCPRTRR